MYYDINYIENYIFEVNTHNLNVYYYTINTNKFDICQKF